MSIDVVTLALAKAYADELVANGGDPEKTEQIIRDKIDEVLGEIGSIGGSADWAVNDENAAGYIKNRTHYDLGEVYVPNKAADGTELYWEGPTGNEVYGQDYFIAVEQDGTYFYAYKVSNNTIDFKDMDSIGGDNLILNYQGTLTKGNEIFEDFKPQEIAPGYAKAIMADGVPVLVSVIQGFDLSLVGQEGTASSGIYFIYAEMEEEKIYLAQVKYQKIKQLDLKYIPDLAFGDIEARDYGSQAQVTITKRDGTTQKITINDGQAGSNGATFTPSVSEDGYLSWSNDKYLTNPTTVKIKGENGYTPQRGLDYMTDEDIEMLKAAIEEEIIAGEW